MKQKLLLFAVITLFSAVSAFAQTNSKITGQIKDANGAAVNAATIMLYRSKDSALVKTAVSDKIGTRFYRLKFVIPCFIRYFCFYQCRIF